MYIKHVLPILDYCSTIWNPALLGEIDRLEKMQKRFTKRHAGLWNVPYTDRLLACGLTSLELRGLICDLTLCFKIVHKFIAIDLSDLFVFDENNRTRGHSYKLILPEWNSNFRRNFFSVRIVPVWNALTVAAVNSPSVKLFKKELIYCDL